MSKRLISLIVVMLLVLAGLFVWQPWQKTSPIYQPSESTVRVTRRNISATVLATGKVLPQTDAEIKVGARISGRLEKLLVKVGETVTKGQVIALIESDELKASVAEVQAEYEVVKAKLARLKREGPKEVAMAKAEVDERLAALAFACAEFNRHDKLLHKNSLAKQAWEESSKNYKMAKALVDVAQRKLDLAKARMEEGIKLLIAQVVKAEASLLKAKVKLSYARITSPISGQVASVATRQGETVAAGMNAPTFVTILDPAKMQVDAYVDEVDIGKIKIGQKARFTVDAYPDKVFKGIVRAILPRAVITDNVVTYDCIIAIDKADSKFLRPQMTANTTITTRHIEEALILPNKAIKMSKGQNVVYRRINEKVVEIPIKLGWREDRFAQIVKGLKPGDSVLISPVVQSQNR